MLPIICIHNQKLYTICLKHIAVPTMAQSCGIMITIVVSILYIMGYIYGGNNYLPNTSHIWLLCSLLGQISKIGQN